MSVMFEKLIEEVEYIKKKYFKEVFSFKKFTYKLASFVESSSQSIISPFMLNKAAEAGNLDEFIRLYQFDNTRLTVKDGKGRTVSHQAAAKNKLNILQFVRDQNGGT